MSLVQQSEWINTLGYSPLLRYSVLASLLSEYVPDGVGISPTTLHVTKTMQQQSLQLAKGPGDSKGLQNGELEWLRRGRVQSAILSPEGQGLLTCNPLHPFNHPQEGPRARAFTPDNMEPEEIAAFPEYYK